MHGLHCLVHGAPHPGMLRDTHVCCYSGVPEVVAGKGLREVSISPLVCHS